MFVCLQLVLLIPGDVRTGPFQELRAMDADLGPACGILYIRVGQLPIKGDPSATLQDFVWNRQKLCLGFGGFQFQT